MPRYFILMSAFNIRIEKEPVILDKSLVKVVNLLKQQNCYSVYGTCRTRLFDTVMQCRKKYIIKT